VPLTSPAMATSRRRLSTAVPLLYPMYAMPVETLLQMGKHNLKCHQQLLEAGLLRQWEPCSAMGPVAFIPSMDGVGSC